MTAAEAIFELPDSNAELTAAQRTEGQADFAASKAINPRIAQEAAKRGLAP